jgi:hypothetical protein
VLVRSELVSDVRPMGPDGFMRLAEERGALPRRRPLASCPGVPEAARYGATRLAKERGGAQLDASDERVRSLVVAFSHELSVLGAELSRNLTSCTGRLGLAATDRYCLPGVSFPRDVRDGPSNTRDQLRGAHDLALVHDDLVSDDDAPTRLQPPLVSCIALLDGAAHSPHHVAAVAGDTGRPVADQMVTPTSDATRLTDLSRNTGPDTRSPTRQLEHLEVQDYAPR